MVDHERHESHDSRALNGGRELALVPGADAGTAARHDLRVRRDEAAERGAVFVVDGVLVIGAERADFVFWLAFRHNL